LTLCLGWWLAAYVLTLNLQGWIFTELATLKAGRLPFTAMLADRATFGHCPLYFVLSWVIQKTMGENMIALRLPSVVVGLLSALVVYRLVRRWASAGAAVFASLIVLLSPLHLEISQQARPYALALLFGLIATDIMIGSEENQDLGRAVCFGIVSLLGLLTSHAYWFVLAAHAVVFAINARRNVAMIAAAAVAFLGAVPWMLYAKFWAESGGESERFLVWMGPVEWTTSLALPGRLAGLVLIEPDSGVLLVMGVTLVTVTLAAIGLSAIPRPSGAPRPVTIRSTLACLWVVPPLAALAAGLLGWGNLLYVPRYFAAAAIVQLVLIAWAVWTARPAIRPMAVFLLAICLAGTSILHLSEVGRDEIRRSARAVEAEHVRGEAIIMISDHSSVRLFKQYMSSPVISSLVDLAPVDGLEVSDRNFPQHRGRKRGAWILVSRKNEPMTATSREGHFEIAAYLEGFRRNYRREDSRSFGEYELVHFSDRIRRHADSSPDRG